MPYLLLLISLFVGSLSVYAEQLDTKHLALVSFPSASTPLVMIQSLPDVNLSRVYQSEMLDGLPYSDIVRARKVARSIYTPYWPTVADRSRYVRARILAVLARMDAPDGLQVVPIVESAYNPYAFSHAGAMGLWQLMPGTARFLGMRQSEGVNLRRDVVSSTENALRYLMSMKQRFTYWALALAAYHRGPAAMRHRLKKHPWKPKDGLGKLPVPLNTLTYVQQTLGLASLLHHHALSFPKPIPTRAITLYAPIDLRMLAKASGLKVNMLFHLNPGLNHSQYLHGKFTLYVPETLADELLSHTKQAKPSYIQMRIRSGDNLWTLARKYGVSIAYLHRINPRIKNTLLHPGDRLRVPAHRFSQAAPAANPLLSRGRRIHYRVRHGDNLWNLAIKFGTTAKAIARANGIKQSTLLHPGDRLWILARIRA